MKQDRNCLEPSMFSALNEWRMNAGIAGGVVDSDSVDV